MSEEASTSFELFDATDLVRGARAAGKSMARVHVVKEPLNDYLTFQLTWAYPANVEAART